MIEAWITGRDAGVGEAPYTGLNLGGHVGDSIETVETNRVRLSDAIGVPRDRLLFMAQVHGTTVLPVAGPWAGDVPTADGIITAVPDLALAVLVADCVPVLLHDASAGVVGAVHAGRPGMIAGIMKEALARMRRLGADEIRAVVGPSVCGRCYEVPAAMAREAAVSSPASAARSWVGTHAIDVASGVVEQLSMQGVAVQWLPGCTREDHGLYSYRRDGRTGRFAGVIVMRGPESGRA